MSGETLALFFTTSLLLALSPGPDNLYVLAQSAAHGRRQGWFITLGLCSGLLIHTLLVLAGVAAVIRDSWVALTLLKTLGAGYLLYLAWQSLSASGELPLPDAATPAMRPWHLYRRGILMNLGNPKVAVFFLAFLPQFTHPQQGSLAGQIMLLGTLFACAALLVFGLITLLAAAIGNWLLTWPRARILLPRVSGIVLATIALSLLVDVLRTHLAHS